MITKNDQEAVVSVIEAAGGFVVWENDNESVHALLLHPTADVLSRVAMLGGPVQTTRLLSGDDSAVEQLSGLVETHELYLCLPEITDASLVHLRRMRGLESLSLYGSRVTDAGMRQLSDLKHLTSLNLGGTRISDHGLEAISRLTNLEGLDICGTSVTDAGLATLSSLRRLREVYVHGTRVSPAGAAALEVAIPRCQVLMKDQREIFKLACSDAIDELGAPDGEEETGGRRSHAG